MLKNGQFTLPIVSCDWFNEHLEFEGLIILDARVKQKDTPISDVIIPNARHIHIKENFSDTTSKFPNTIPSQNQFEKEARQLGINNDSVIVVYDDKGIYWSPRVWWLFRTFGFKNVAVLDGGLPEWKRLGYTTHSTFNSQQWKTGDFLADYENDKMCFFENILEASKNHKTLILDARSENRFNCKTPEPRKGLRSGTIPNSKNLPYTALFNGNCFKSKSELQTIFDTFEIEDRSIIFSCGSGITACILALAADICGLKKLSVYDGSWTEYGTLIT